MKILINCCKFNQFVECATMKCGNCGWNPDVMEKRIKIWKAKRNKKKGS